MKNNFEKLGLSGFRYMQIVCFLGTLLMLLANYLIGASLGFWAIFAGGLFIVNWIWNLFSDVKWDKEGFIIEKFLRKKEIPSNEFVRIDRFFLNVYTLRFKNDKYLYLAGLDSIFSDDYADKLTLSIKERITN